MTDVTVRNSPGLPRAGGVAARRFAVLALAVKLLTTDVVRIPVVVTLPLTTVRPDFAGNLFAVARRLLLDVVTVSPARVPVLTANNHGRRRPRRHQHEEQRTSRYGAQQHTKGKPRHIYSLQKDDRYDAM
jgi:hypothetical protein